MRAVAVVAVLSCATVAYADEPRQFVFSASFLVGGEIAGSTDGGLTLGARPELVYGRPRADFFESNLGFGGYAEIVWNDAQRVVGGGATMVWYRETISIAPSLGIYHAANHDAANAGGVVGSAFLGHRRKHWNVGLDLPVGVRVDLRSTFDGEPSVMACLNVDVLAVVLAPLAALSFKPPG